jgi:hypothetical protein
MFYSLSTLLHVLAASASIPFAAAQTNPIIDELNEKIISPTPPPPGYNVEGTSVFTNFARAFDEKQFFLLGTGTVVFERPGSEPVRGSLFFWCSDLTFSDFSDSSLVGYAGHCACMVLTGITDMVTAGAQLTYEYSEGDFTSTYGISAVFVEKQDVFEGQLHLNTDDLVFRFWDDGRKTFPYIGWEGHGEGDMHPNAATASHSVIAEMTWMSDEEVAQMFNTSTDEFTPKKFKQAYTDAWIKGHEALAKIQTNTAEAALAIIEQVKNETMPADEPATSVQPGETAASSGETAAPAEPGTGEDVGKDPNLIEDDSAGNRRKLASVAARFLSAALRVFGI